MDNAKNFYDGRELTVTSFKNKIFPLYYKKGDFEDEDEDEKEPPRNMPDFETEESAREIRNQRGQGLTPQQILSRLPISLAQLKAENNSKKLQNCIPCID